MAKQECQTTHHACDCVLKELSTLREFYYTYHRLSYLDLDDPSNLKEERKLEKKMDNLLKELDSIEDGLTLTFTPHKKNSR